MLPVMAYVRFYGSPFGLRSIHIGAWRIFVAISLPIRCENSNMPFLARPLFVPSSIHFSMLSFYWRISKTVLLGITNRVGERTRKNLKGINKNMVPSTSGKVGLQHLKRDWSMESACGE